jgi:hypothetical protein
MSRVELLLIELGREMGVLSSSTSDEYIEWRLDGESCDEEYQVSLSPAGLDARVEFEVGRVEPGRLFAARCELVSGNSYILPEPLAGSGDVGVQSIPPTELSSSSPGQDPGVSLPYLLEGVVGSSDTRLLGGL